MEFKWLNKSKIVKTEHRIEIMAPAESDFFSGSPTKTEEGFLPNVLSNAPFYYTDIEGDFVMRVKVSLEFKDIYDAAAIMVMQDENYWAKACFELTDFNTHAVVSVVTRELSDDANGPNLEGNTAWLQVCRVGQDFAFHYSTNGKDFYMMRYFNLPVESKIKVGLVAQAPVGSGGNRIFEQLSIEQKTVKNIRVGN